MKTIALIFALLPSLVWAQAPVTPNAAPAAVPAPVPSTLQPPTSIQTMNVAELKAKAPSMAGQVVKLKFYGATQVRPAGKEGGVSFLPQDKKFVFGTFRAIVPVEGTGWLAKITSDGTNNIPITAYVRIEAPKGVMSRVTVLGIKTDLKGQTFTW
jgi:hypothetical protein